MEQTRNLPGLLDPLKTGRSEKKDTSTGVLFHQPSYQLLYNRPTVSVIVPTLNEAQNLPLVLPFLPMDWIDEVILVDGRSTDGTVEIAKELLPSIKVVMEKKRGKGAALVAGYREASGDVLIVVDADGSNDPREIPRFVTALMQGADMVKGSRFAPGGGTTDMPMLRRLGNKFFVMSVNLLFGSQWTDLCYGYHAFWKHCLDRIEMSDVPGFEIDTALYLRAIRDHLHILEVPSFEGFRFYGIGKLQTFPDGWRVLKTILGEWLQHKKQPPKEHEVGFRGVRPSNSCEVEAPAVSSADLNRQLFQVVTLFLEAGYSINHLMGRVLQLALISMNAISGSIFILDKQGMIHDGCLAFDKQVTKTNGSDHEEILCEGLAGWAFRNLQPAIVNNTREDPRWLRRSWDEDEAAARSALVIPLVLNDNRVCVLTLVRPQEKQFTQADLELFYQAPA